MRPLLGIAVLLILIQGAAHSEPYWVSNYQYYVGVPQDEHLSNSLEIVRHVNNERQARGLNPMEFNPRAFGALTMFATEYSLTMADNQEIKHGFPKSSVWHYLNLWGLHHRKFRAYEYTIVELLALRSIPDAYSVPERQSRVFDNSSEHASWLYHEGAEHLGWSYVIRHGRIWITAYVFVREQ